jgi:hypothetical protein
MTKTGDIQKMHTTLEGSHAIYHLPIDNDLVALKRIPHFVAHLSSE